MAVSDETARVEHTADGTTVVFAVTFRFLAEGDLLVETSPDNGFTWETKTLNTDYTVQGAGADAGGSVTFNTAPTNQHLVGIQRGMTFTQPIEYQERGPFPAKTHETGLDRGIMLLQQMNLTLGRSLKLPRGAPETMTAFPPPTAPTTLQSYIRWNMATNPPTLELGAPEGPGVGDVLGPASAVVGNVAMFVSSTGKSIGDAGFLATQVARLDVANAWAVSQLLQFANPVLGFYHTGGAVDTRRYRIVATGDTIAIEARTDADGAADGGIVLKHGGGLHTRGTTGGDLGKGSINGTTVASDGKPINTYDVTGFYAGSAPQEVDAHLLIMRAERSFILPDYGNDGKLAGNVICSAGPTGGTYVIRLEQHTSGAWTEIATATMAVGSTYTDGWTRASGTGDITIGASDWLRVLVKTVNGVPPQNLSYTAIGLIGARTALS